MGAFSELQTIKDLKYILNASKRYEFAEDSNGDVILKISALYENKTVYINFNELILLLENYSGVNRILSNELEEVNELKKAVLEEEKEL